MQRLQHMLLQASGRVQACPLAMLRCEAQMPMLCLRGLSTDAAAAAPAAHDAAAAEQHAASSVSGSDDSRREDMWPERHADADADAAGAAALEAFRQSNTSLPYLQGQVVKAHVVAVDKHTVMLDPGYKFTQRFFKNELAGAPIYSDDGRSLGVPEAYQVGDILHVKIEQLETPFGEMQLSLGGKLSEAEQMDAVIAEMLSAHQSGTSVMGRILNPVNRGYSVGVAGLVCFLPMTQCMFQTAQRVGVLQEFKVLTVKPETRNVVLVDATKVGPRFGGFGASPLSQAQPFQRRYPPGKGPASQGQPPPAAQDAADESSRPQSAASEPLSMVQRLFGAGGLPGGSSGAASEQPPSSKPKEQS